MKKWISVALATFCTASFVEAASNPTYVQFIACSIGQDPQQCIKSADMLLEMSKKITKNSLLRCEFYERNEEECKLIPDKYQQTDKEFFNEQIAFSYSNAGIIYNRNNEYKKAVDMFKKAIKYNPNYDLANSNLGVNYFLGEGIAMDKFKAYEHWRISAKQGNEGAQKNLDILCKESPWVCKK